MPDTKGRLLQDRPGAVDDIKHLEGSIGRIKFFFLRLKVCEKGRSSFQAEHNAPLAQRNGEIAERIECLRHPKDCSRRSGEGIFKTVVLW